MQSLLKFGVMLALYAHAETPATPSDYTLGMPPVQQVGLASWYGGGDGDHGLHGKITATGEVFDPSAQTCASRTIPLNTVVMVEDVRSGRRAWCRVNDRGPYGAIYQGDWIIKTSSHQPGKWRGVMDLSRGTAKALGFSFRSGLNPIKIRYHRGAYGVRYPKKLIWPTYADFELASITLPEVL
jgi:rare lipoprotein A